MGKGYNNYMCKKPFHPGSKANIKRAWMAEQKTENEKRKQEELKVQYEKEQDLYNNRALISTESKDKLELNFMYEAPPGAKRERQKEDDEPEYKFEWQRKYNAPREDYAKGNADIKDQPFGIPVRNVRCIKCHKWGHINTDKECPLFSQASTSSMPTTSMDPMELMRQMREDGYGLKENVLGHHLNPKAANQQLIPSDESDPEMEFLKSLSTTEKKKLLRKLKKLSKKQEKTNNCKKKKNRKSRKSKRSSDSDCGVKKKCKKSKKVANDSNTDSSTDESEVKVKKEKKKKSGEKKSTKVKRKSTSESSSSDTESEEDKEQLKKSKRGKCEKIEDSDKINVEKHSKNNWKSSTSNTKQIISEEYYKSNEHKISDHAIERNVNTSKSSHKMYSKEKSVSSSDDTFSLNPDQRVHGKEYKKSKKEKTARSHKVSESSDNSDQHKKDTLKRKGDKESSKDVSAKRKKSECEGNKRELKNVDDPDHPDGFSHFNPQAIVKSNYLQALKEYEGASDDKFRSFNRDRRSPSVKQKYKK